MLIVWDVDGTLLDSWPHYERATRAYCTENNLQLPDLARLKHGFGHPQWFDYGWPGTLEEQNDIRFAIYDKFYEIDRQPGEHVPLFPGIAATVRRLAVAGHRHTIVTSRPHEPLMRMLEREGLQDSFTTILAEETRKSLQLKGKPFPDPLHYIMREYGVGPRDLVMVGDTEMDVAMGRAAGIAAIGVQWGMHDCGTLQKAGAHFTPRTQAELLDAIERLHSGAEQPDLSVIPPPYYPRPTGKQLDHE